MKTKILGASIIAASLLCQLSFAQTDKKNEKMETKKKVDRSGKKKIDQKDVPVTVKESFSTIYPTTGIYDWYSFPYYWDYEPDTNNYVVEYDYPEYYEVDYLVDNMPTKTVLSKTGKHVNTSKSMKFADLPDPVKNGFKSSYYKDWRIIDHETEEVTNPDTKEKTYKIVAYNGGAERKVLHFDANGKQIQGKKMKTKMKKMK